MNILNLDRSGVPLFQTLLSDTEQEASPEDRLSARQNILNRTIQACEAFLRRELSAFDPSVGDQACQIRSLNFCMLSRGDHAGEVKKLLVESLQGVKEVEEIRRRLLAFEALKEEQVDEIRTKFIDPLSGENKRIGEEMAKALEGVTKGGAAIRKSFTPRFAAVKKKKAPFQARIAELERGCRASKNEVVNRLDIRTGEVALKVIQAFVLTMVRDQQLRQDTESGEFQYSEHTKVRKLEGSCNTFPLGLMNGVVDIAKNALAMSSIVFVQQQARLLKTEDAELLQKMVGNLRVVPKKEREELPFFHMTRIIFERALEMDIPVLLRIRNITAHPLQDESYICRMLFRPNSEKFAHVIDEVGEEEPFEAIVINAFSKAKPSQLVDLEFQSTMISKADGLLGLIDMNAVQHSQYTDQEPDSEKVFDQIPGLETSEKARLMQLKEKGIKEGFSNENPALCCIDHIFCDRITGP